MTELKLSDNTQKYIREAFEKCGRELQREMQVASIDQLQVSLDLTVKGPLVVKFTALKHEGAIVRYQLDLKKENT